MIYFQIDRTKYMADISFVGSTYNEDRQNFYKYISEVDKYTEGYLRAIIKMQGEIYGNFILEELLINCGIFKNNRHLFDIIYGTAIHHMRHIICPCGLWILWDAAVFC